jgi:NAD(P)-dependent dehydrogenase (short-subunit alcohol dehydrogenase family)
MAAPESTAHLDLVSRIGVMVSEPTAPSGSGRVRRETMLMSVIEGFKFAPQYSEIAGRRILITGMSRTCGVDIARAFAEQGAKLVLQFDETSEEMQAVSEMLAPLAADIAIFSDAPHGTDAIVKFARSAMTAVGGIDAVINIVSLNAPTANPTTPEAVERAVSELLLLPCLVSRIAANRMRLTLTEGVVLTIATLPDAQAGEAVDKTARAFAAVAKAALATMTRGEARQWADQAIRFNAVAPSTLSDGRDPALSGETDIAALALYLISGRGKSLSGLVFDADYAPA